MIPKAFAPLPLAIWRLKQQGAQCRQSHQGHILLALDENSGPVKDQTEIAGVLKVSPSTIRMVAQIFCRDGVEAALARKKRETPPVPAKVTGEVEAHIM
jgi:DNA-binding MarR family transcriptional regulator